jgi:hypothetical protein
MLRLVRGLALARCVLPLPSLQEKYLIIIKPKQSPQPSQPLTYLETKRKEAQELYLEEMAFIEKNKPEFERLIEQDKAAMAGQMPDNLFGVLGAIVGGRPGRGKEEEGKSGEGEVKVTKA